MESRKKAWEQGYTKNGQLHLQMLKKTILVMKYEQLITEVLEILFFFKQSPFFWKTDCIIFTFQTLYSAS